MAQLTRDDVLKLAQLAKLDLSEEEVGKYVKELTKILDYIEQLKSIDVDGLEPTSQVTGLTNVMRPDKIYNYGTNQKDLLKNVPSVKDGQIKVKRTIE